MVPNITPISNVYPVNGKVTSDKKFQSQIKGKNALVKMLNRLTGAQGFHISSIEHQLTKEQIRQWKDDAACALSATKNLVWGVVLKNGILVEECRCTETGCKRFKQCRPTYKIDINDEKRQVVRQPVIKKEPETRMNFNNLGRLNPKTEEISASIEKVEPIQQEINIEIDFEDYNTFEIDPFDETVEDAISGFNCQQDIIEAKTEDKLLVLAGPGTGKTYSLIERLKYITVNDDINPADEMLVLCFSRAAVKEIRDRFIMEVNALHVSDDLSRLDIRTFDSFATQLLIATQADLVGKDYDSRIEMTIEAIENRPELLENLKHFVVDEIQDLVGVRARLIQTILKYSPGGFSLFGDSYQGIYDYQIKDIQNELDSKGFLAWLKEYFKSELKTVHLTVNYRQENSLAHYSSRMRALLDNESGLEKFRMNIDSIPSSGCFHHFNFPQSGGKVGILCRTNGQALKISEFLRQRNIRHHLKRQQSDYVLPPWIAQVMNKTFEKLSYGQFATVFPSQYKMNDEELLFRFNALKGLDESYGELLNPTKIIKKLAAGMRLPEEIYHETDSMITVTTIHQSKGREYDSVVFTKSKYLVVNSYEDKLEEAKVYYVAITRAKTDLSSLEQGKEYLKKTENGNGRWIETVYNFVKKKPVIHGLEIGRDGDINQESFVDRNFIEDPGDNQRYIVEKVKEGDRLELFNIALEDNAYCYGIYHNERLIGTMSDNFNYSLRTAVKEIYGGGKYLPNLFEDIYVDKLCSIAKLPETVKGDVPKNYLKTGLWLGITVVGLGTVRWFD